MLKAYMFVTNLNLCSLLIMIIEGELKHFVVWLNSNRCPTVFDLWLKSRCTSFIDHWQQDEIAILRGRSPSTKWLPVWTTQFRNGSGLQYRYRQWWRRHLAAVSSTAGRRQLRKVSRCLERERRRRDSIRQTSEMVKRLLLQLHPLRLSFCQNNEGFHRMLG